MSDVTRQVEAHGTTGTITVLFDSVELQALESTGARVEDMIAYRDKGGDWRSPTIRWKVRGSKRIVMVSHVIHGIVGERRTVRYNSTDERVTAPVFDLRSQTHFVTEPQQAPRMRRRGRNTKTSSRGPRFSVEETTIYRLLDCGEVAGEFETEAEAKAAAYDLLA